MEYFYILLIQYMFAGELIESQIYLESAQQCQVAIRAMEQLSTDMDADLFCVQSDIASGSIRPKARPDDLLKP